MQSTRYFCKILINLEFSRQIFGTKKKNIYYFCRSLIKLEFHQQIFEKVSNIKFHQNPSSGSRVVSCRRTDEHEANCRFSQFCERALKCTQLYELLLITTAPPKMRPTQNGENRSDLYRCSYYINKGRRTYD